MRERSMHARTWARRWREGDRLPHQPARTRSGKIMRRLLKARELGCRRATLSTLESDEQK